MSALRSPLHVEIDGDGPALVLLHGGGGGADDLAGLRDGLREGRRIIAPDQRAHGRSPDLGELSYAAMAADTAALLDELGVRAADVVGWSDGGIIGLLVARDRPDLVGRLVAISANVSWALPAPAAMREASFEWLRAATAADIEIPAGRAELTGAVDAWPGIVDKLLAMWQGDPGITLTDLARIDAPVLYLAGDHDVVRNEHTLAMFEATPDAQLAIIPDADHWVAQRPLSIVVPIIERFLAGAAGPPPLRDVAGDRTGDQSSAIRSRRSIRSSCA